MGWWAVAPARVPKGLDRMNVRTRLDQSEQQSEIESMGSSPASAPAQVSLIEIWEIARLRMRVILGAAASILILTALFDLSLTPLYKGTAIVMIDERENKTVNVEAVLSGLPTDQASILNQIQILQSHELAWRVISKLRLDRDEEFNGSLRKPWTYYLAWLDPFLWFPAPATTQSEQEEQQKVKDAVVDRFERRLGVAQIQLSTALQIDFESKEPEKAARIANAIADAYVEDQLNAKFEATLKATQWLAGRLGQLADQARRAQDAVEQYKADNHITEVVGPTGSGVISVLDQQIGALNTQLVQAHTDVAQADANVARVRSLVSSGHVGDVTQVVGSTLIDQLKQQQAELVQKQAEMSMRYGPNHPKMLDLQAEKRDLDAKIREETSHVVGTVENDAAIARAREYSLQSSLNGLESQSTVQGQARVKLRELEANAGSSQALYDTFVARSKETQQQEGLQIPDARIISRSAIPISPSFPNNTLVFAIAIVGSLFAGFVVAFVLERLDRGFRTSARAEEVLGYPVLSTLPDVGFDRERSRNSQADASGSQSKIVNAADIIVDRPLSSYSEAIRALQLGIALSNVDSAPKVVLITSALPGEGKTTTALSLARHIAQTGRKVVLVDADLRRPSVSAVANIGEVTHDLISLLKGEASLDQAMIKDPKSGVMVLATAKQVKNAPDLIESQALARVVKDLRVKFDTIIVDTAPILPVTDTRILARLADTVLFVVRWEQTPRDAATDAVKSLRDVHAPIAGVALTRADSKRFHYYSFGYSGYYSTYAKYYEA
jgi:polysaccharide biosynthesis transport protein